MWGEKNLLRSLAGARQSLKPFLLLGIFKFVQIHLASVSSLREYVVVDYGTLLDSKNEVNPPMKCPGHKVGLKCFLLLEQESFRRTGPFRQLYMIDARAVRANSEIKLLIVPQESNICWLIELWNQLRKIP